LFQQKQIQIVQSQKVINKNQFFSNYPHFAVMNKIPPPTSTNTNNGSNMASRNPSSSLSSGDKSSALQPINTAVPRMIQRVSSPPSFQPTPSSFQGNISSGGVNSNQSTNSGVNNYSSSPLVAQVAPKPAFLKPQLQPQSGQAQRQQVVESNVVDEASFVSGLPQAQSAPKAQRAVVVPMAQLKQSGGSDQTQQQQPRPQRAEVSPMAQIKTIGHDASAGAGQRQVITVSTLNEIKPMTATAHYLSPSTTATTTTILNNSQQVPEKELDTIDTSELEEAIGELSSFTSQAPSSPPSRKQSMSAGESSTTVRRQQPPSTIANKQLTPELMATGLINILESLRVVTSSSSSSVSNTTPATTTNATSSSTATPNQTFPRQFSTSRRNTTSNESKSSAVPQSAFMSSNIHAAEMNNNNSSAQRRRSSVTLDKIRRRSSVVLSNDAEGDGGSGSSNLPGLVNTTAETVDSSGLAAVPFRRSRAGSIAQALTAETRSRPINNSDDTKKPSSLVSTTEDAGNVVKSSAMLMEADSVYEGYVAIRTTEGEHFDVRYQKLRAAAMELLQDEINYPLMLPLSLMFE
jgi:hypothetical protein